MMISSSARLSNPESQVFGSSRDFAPVLVGGPGRFKLVRAEICGSRVSTFALVRALIFKSGPGRTDAKQGLIESPRAFRDGLLPVRPGPVGVRESRSHLRRHLSQLFVGGQIFMEKSPVEGWSA